MDAFSKKKKKKKKTMKIFACILIGELLLQERICSFWEKIATFNT